MKNENGTTERSYSKSKNYSFGKGAFVLTAFIVGCIVNEDVWILLSTPMLVVVGILSAAMFTRSGARSPIDSVVPTADLIEAKKQANNVEIIQDYLKNGVRLALLVAILQVARPALVGIGSVLDLGSIFLSERYPSNANIFLMIQGGLASFYQGIVSAFFCRVLTAAWVVVDLDSFLLSLQHKNFYANIEKTKRKQKTKVELKEMEGVTPPESVQGYGRIVGNINQTPSD